MDTMPSFQEFEAACLEHFGFLIREYGFVRAELPQYGNPFSVRFRKTWFFRRPLVVHVYGEGYGAIAACRLIHGKKKPVALGYLVPRAERPSRRQKRENIPGQLEQIGRLGEELRLHAADILRGDMRRYDLALEEERRFDEDHTQSDEQVADRPRRTAATDAGHAFKRGDHAKVITLLTPFESRLSKHQGRMLAASLRALGPEGAVIQERLSRRGPSLTLTTHTGHGIDDPSPDTIRRLVESIPPRSDDAFVVLQRDRTHFMQAAGNPTDGFVLEYQDGGRHEHFQSTDAALSVDTIVRAMIDYADGKHAWHDMVSWDRLQLS